MTTKLSFEGYSDDLVHVGVNDQFKEYNCYGTVGGPAVFGVYGDILEQDESGEYMRHTLLFYINAFYGINGATWTFAVEQVDELEDLIPSVMTNWTIRSRVDRSPYSVVLESYIANPNIRVELIKKGKA